MWLSVKTDQNGICYFWIWLVWPQIRNQNYFLRLRLLILEVCCLVGVKKIFFLKFITEFEISNFIFIEGQKEYKKNFHSCHPVLYKVRWLLLGQKCWSKIQKNFFFFRWIQIQQLIYGRTTKKIFDFHFKI